MRRAVVIAMLVIAPRLAHAQPAQPPQPPSDHATSDAARAAAALQEGKALFARGLYSAAIERYEASFAIVPAADTQFAIAEAYRAEGDQANALRAYNLYQSLKDPNANKPTGEIANPFENPEVIDPSQLPVKTEAPRPVVPRSLVQRTLLIPSRVNEGWVSSAGGQQTYRQVDGSTWRYVAAGAGGRLGFGFGELFAGFTLAIVHTDPAKGMVEVPIFQNMSAGMTFRIGDDTGVGAAFTGSALDSDFSVYAPSVHVSHKLRTSDDGAIVLAADASYLIRSIAIGFDERGVGGSAAVGFELQMQPAVALEAFGALGGAWYFETGFGERRAQLLYEYGAQLVMAVSGGCDVVPFFGFAQTSATDTYAGGVQFTFH